LKEIKAYIRTASLADTVRELQEARAPGITVVSVHPVGYGFDPNYFLPESDDPVGNYCAITKLEIVCNDEDVDRFVEIISGKSYTGTKGDGMIFVASVDRVIRIRTGEQGKEAL
jgi:nitrogen regulatory protein P-II 1